MRSDGSSSSSTAAKNASRSRWARIGTTAERLRCRGDHRYRHRLPRSSSPRRTSSPTASWRARRHPERRRVIVRVGLADARRHAAPRPPLPAPSRRCRRTRPRCEVITVNRAGRRSRADRRRTCFGGRAARRRRCCVRRANDVLLAARRCGGSRSASAARAGSTSRTSTTGAGAAWNARATFPAASSPEARDRGHRARTDGRHADARLDASTGSCARC